MSKQVLIKNKRVSYNDIVIDSAAVDGRVHITVGNELTLSLTEEEFLGLYDIIGHLVDWQ